MTVTKGDCVNVSVMYIHATTYSQVTRAVQDVTSETSVKLRYR